MLGEGAKEVEKQFQGDREFLDQLVLSAKIQLESVRSLLNVVDLVLVIRETAQAVDPRLERRFVSGNLRCAAVSRFLAGILWRWFRVDDINLGIVGVVVFVLHSVSDKPL